MDEGASHMHLMYILIVYTKDEQGNSVDKICARDFWKGRDSYRNLQNAYYKHVKEKGFDLERGLFVEETNRKHFSIEEYKNITNYRKTKETLKNITLELPRIPDINDIKLIKLNKEKVINEIINPQDNIIQKLHNVFLHKELSKQVNLVNEVIKCIKEDNSILNENHKLSSQIKELELKYETKLDDIEYSYKKKINKLEEKITFLEKVVNRFKTTVNKFIHYICDKFSVSPEDMLIRDFEKETHNTSI